jgi:hypothetical protein
MLERRLDEALDLRVAGERRLLHVEIELDLDDEDALLLMALHVEASKAPLRPKLRADPDASERRSKPRARVPVHSVVIVLRGRKEPWPEEGEYGNDWPELPWSGTRFRVEAVYQRTVAELCARGGLLWRVFTPLAADASAGAMREVIDDIRGRTAPDEVRAALYTALMVMAEIDPWGHNLKKEITAMMQADDLEIYKLSPTLRAAFEEGELKAKQELLCEAFAEQAGRAPTSDEQAALAKRTRELGAKHALRALFKLHGDALVVWLLGNGEEETVGRSRRRVDGSGAARVPPSPRRSPRRAPSPHVERDGTVNARASYRRNPGSPIAHTKTPSTHSTPPETTDALTPASAATAPDSTFPSSGPVM